MRKYLFMSMLCLCIGMFFVSQVNAMPSGGTKLYINAGAITDDNFGYFYWQVGTMLDVPLGGRLFVTPEVMLIGYKFDFKSLFLYPGATINLKFGKNNSTFFLGGGALLYFRLKPSGKGTELLPKIHVGYLYKNIKLTAYFYTFTKSDFFKFNYLGINVGIAL